MFLWKCLRGFTYGLTASTVVVSAYFLHRNNYDISSVGAVRCARAGIAVGRIVIDYKITMAKDEKDASKQRKNMSAAHKRCAEILLKLACANGGVFIKVGQHLAALEYLLPPEYIQTLGILHSKAPESSFDDVRKVIETDLNCKIEDIFSEFDSSPIGAASLAQVYKAKLRKTGDIVAVKVQHSRVKPHSIVDMASMELLVNIAAKLFPEFHLMWLVEETKKNLPLELDFVHEAANADSVRRIFSHFSFLKIPEIYYDYTTDRVLTMEFCEGAQVNDVNYFIKNGINRNDVCRKLGALYSEMIFVKGLVHCDPHPGNVLVHKGDDGKISLVLLDHGLYLTLHDDFRMKYTKLWLSILKPDEREIKKCATEMGVGDLYGLFACMVTSRSWKSVTEGVAKTTSNDNEREEIKAYAACLIPQISEALERMPRPMILILKTNDLLRSIEYRLGTQNRSDAFLQMARCCIRSMCQFTLKNTDSVFRILIIYFEMYFELAKLFIYENYLMLAHWNYVASS